MAKLTPEKTAKILAELKKGRTLRDVCKDKGMPSHYAVLELAENDREFGRHYIEARRLGYLAMADDLLAIADDDSADRTTHNGRSVWDHENINRSRLKVDTRKWLLSKCLPKMFGDKVELTHQAGDSVTELLNAVDGETRGIPAKLTLPHTKIEDDE